MSKKAPSTQANTTRIWEPLSPLTSAHWLIPTVILSFIAFIVYHPSLHYNFQFDDVANISKFYSIRYHTIKTLFLATSRWISYWLNTFNYQLGKFDPFYYRFFNVIFHTTTGILIFFFVLYALSLRKERSFFTDNKFLIACTTSLLFLLHPVQTQTVSYVIQGQLEGLACLFMMCMSLCFLFSQTLTNKLARFVCTFLLFFAAFLACGTKEIIIISPILLILIDWFFVAQGDVRSLAKRWWLHLIVMTIVFGMYIYFLKPSFFKNALGLSIEARNNIGNLLTEMPGEPIKPLHYCISQFKVILHYITIFIWPFTISVEYDWKLVKHFFAPDCFLPFLVLCAIVSALFFLLRKNKTHILGFCALWFFVAILPRSSIIPSSELLSDYKTYMPSVGILFLLACIIVYLIKTFTESESLQQLGQYRSSAQPVLVLLFALPLGFLTYQRNKVWRSSEEFWTNIIENAPGKARAYNNLGVALSEQGRMQESVPLYKKAIAMDRFYPDPWNNLAVAYSLTNKLDLAVDTLKEALRIHPYYPEGYNNLASFMITKKEYAIAEQLLQRAVQLRPHYGKAHFNRGKMYLEQGKNEQALESFKAACMQGDLDNAAGFSIYAQVSMGLQKYHDAIFAYQKLLEFQPGHFDTAFNLANAYYLSNQFPQALSWYKKLLSSHSHEARLWHNMGEVYFKLNQPDQALSCFVQAETLKLSTPTLDLRIAGCLEKLGRIPEAQQRLQQCLQKDLPETSKNTARVALAQLAARNVTA